MSNFDPFTATLEEAKAQPDAYASPDGAITRCAAARQLIALRDYYERQPLDGMAVCARAGLVAPDWLAKSFLRGFRAVAGHRARTWDEAFGPAHAKGANLEALQEQKLALYRVSAVVSDFVSMHPDLSLADLFAKASELDDLAPDDPVAPFARRLGCGKTEADRHYRRAVAIGLMHPVGEIRESLGWPAKPRRARTPAKSAKRAGVRMPR